YNQQLTATNGWGAFAFHTIENGGVYVGTDVMTRLTPNELPGGTVSLNSWQHFAFTFDHGTGCFYKNGTLLATKSGMNLPLPWSGFLVGVPSTDTIDGQIDELRIWSRALPAPEIQRYKSRQRSGTEAGLLGYWRWSQEQKGDETNLTPYPWQTILHNVHALLPQVPTTISDSVFQLAGHSQLSLLNERIFEGDLQITNESLWMSGQLTLFPEAPALQVASHVQGWINRKEFYLAGEATVALAGLLLSQARVILSNNLILLSGTCLGVTTTLEVSQQQQECIVTGTIHPTLKVNVDSGQILSGTTLLAQNAHLDLDVGAQLEVTITASGFSASVSAWTQYNGKNLSVGPFTLTTAPADTTALAAEVRKQIKDRASQFFQTIYPDAKAWLLGIADGTIGWTSGVSQDMGKVLKNAYGQSLKQTAALLSSTGKTAMEVGKAVYSVYTTSINELSSALASASYSGDQVGDVLKNVYGASIDGAAGALKQASYAVSDIGRMLQRVYSADANKAAWALKQAGYTADQVGGVVSGIYRASGDGAAGALKQANYAVDEIGRMLQHIYSADASKAAWALKQAGYTADQVGGVVSGVYKASVDGAAGALKQANYAVDEIGRMLQHVYSTDTNKAAWALKQAGYTADQVGGVLRGVYGASTDGAAGALKQANYAADEIGQMLHNVYSTDASGAARALKQAGYTANQVGGVLKDIFTSDSGVAAQALHDAGFGAEESIQVLKSTFEAGLGTLISVLKNTWSLSKGDVLNILEDLGFSAWDLLSEIGNFF
ncbi:MAG TPA: LamG-like jellyroll fold domain-containing protein, partial [Ktedonobacteraceae bacterium]|nr:LamG-like jellyroll fold domain-containing protein [Ktedonobacteraceae bacterium]